MKSNKLTCIVCASMVAIATILHHVPVYADTVSDIILDPDARTEIIAEAIAEKVNPVYGPMVKGAIASLDLVAMDDGWMIYDPTADVYYGVDTEGYLVKQRSGEGGGGGTNEGGGGGRCRVTSADDIEISGEVFADVVARLNEQYAPSTPYYISAETDKRWTTNNTGGVMSFYADGVFCNQSNWTEVYCLPFYRDGDEIYYSLYQSHFKQRLETGEDGTNSIYMDVDWLFNADHTVASSTTIYSEQSGSPLVNFVDIRYMDYTYVFSSSHNRMYTYSSYANYVQKKGEMFAAALDYDNANSPIFYIKLTI